MAIQTRQEQFSKETDDVLVLLINVVTKIKNKVPLAEIAGGEVADLMNALSGADQIGPEFSANFEVALRTVLSRSAELAAALIKPAVAAAPIVHV